MQRFRMSQLLATALCLGATATTAQITNGSFEDGGGSFTGWEVVRFVVRFERGHVDHAGCLLCFKDSFSSAAMRLGMAV